MIHLLFLSRPDLISKIHELMPDAKNIYNLDSVLRRFSNLTPQMETCLLQIRLFILLNRLPEARLVLEQNHALPDSDYTRAVCLFAEALIYSKEGRYAAALPILEQVIHLAGPHRILRASAYHLAGRSHFYLKKYASAREFLHKALQVNIEEISVLCYQDLSAVTAQLQQYKEARQNLVRAIDLKPGDDRNQLLCERDHGYLERLAHHYESALQHFHRALLEAAAQRDVDLVVRLLTSIAEANYKLNQVEPALTHIEKALKMTPYLPDRAALAHRINVAAEIERKYVTKILSQHPEPSIVEKSVQRANTLLEQGLDLARELNDYRLMASLWYNRGLLERNQWHDLAALAAFNQSAHYLTHYMHDSRELSDPLKSRIFKKFQEVAMHLTTRAKSGQAAVWVETEKTERQIELQPRDYHDALFQQLEAALSEFAQQERWIKPVALAEMLSFLQGDWFKNIHYTYLGYAWSTATRHLRILVQRGILEKSGHAKGTSYRLHPEFCPLIPAD